jgi:S-DNA-T family DNA segregation ATPase FtsK/SpoIIIE
LALGAFLGCVEFLGWDGGVVGLKLDNLLHLLVGRTAAVAPPLLIAVGAMIFVDSRLRHVRPLRLGTAIFCTTLMLALSSSDTKLVERHGGLLGSYLRSALEGLIGGIGVSILIVLGFLAAIVLVTGASVGVMMASSGRHVARAAETSARLGGEVARRYRDRPSSKPTLVAVPGPSKGKGRKPLDGSQEYADIFADPPELDSPADEPSAGLDQPEPQAVIMPEAQADLDEAITAEVVAPQLTLDSAPRPKTVYRLPSPTILKKSAPTRGGGEDHKQVARKLVEALANFGVEARCIGMVSGPRVTRYELQLAPGIKVSRVSQLRDDLAYALATTEIRILAPIPGKQAVGVEVPNNSHNTVTMGDIFATPPSGSSPLTAWLGKDISGSGVACDLAKMPHLLIAGTTGSGKSGCINALLCSILLRATPDEVRMILVDPKRVELNHYESIPHLLTPVVTNMKNAALVLQNIVREMEARYELMGAVKARNLAEWNRQRLELGQDRVPHILVVIDELADLMMVSPADVEDAIIRLAQKSRAVGIHLVLATQSPRVDVITGMIKANVPSRIAFAVSSQTDSRVILDVNGAEALLGQGDMLYKPLGTSKLLRIQGAYISEEETRKIVEACRKQGEPTFEEDLLELPSDVESEQLDADEDPVLSDAIRLVAQHQTASVSLLQRRLRVGYTRAGRLIDMLERRGIVSGYEGSKARSVLISETDLERILGEPDHAPIDEPVEDLTF